MPLDLAWESFRDSFVRPGVPAVHPTAGARGDRVFVDAGGNRVGLILGLEQPETEVPRSGRALSIRVIREAGKARLEIATGVPSLFEQFYVLACDIVSRIDSGVDTVSAAAGAIESWRELLKDRARLSSDEETGLWGELWFLEFMLNQGHQEALQGWTGPLGDPHDFRIGTTEIEVKTSTSARRHHAISSLEQLIPSKDHSLRLVSILVGATSTDDGRSLKELVRGVQRRLPTSLKPQFETLLSQRGYDIVDEDLFVRRLALRSMPLCVNVDSSFPVLGRSHLTRGCGAETASRILHASYVIDVEGLGTELRDSAVLGA